MKKNRKKNSGNLEIIIPEDQVEIIEVSPENIHIESSSSSSDQDFSSPRSRSKKFSFNAHSSSEPVKLSLGKLFLGCAFFLLLLLGIFISFVVGITKLLQKLFTLIF